MNVMPNSRKFEALTRCYCFSDSSSTVNQPDNRVAATDNAIVAQGKSQVANNGGRVVTLISSGSSASKPQWGVKYGGVDTTRPQSGGSSAGTMAYTESGGVTVAGSTINYSGISDEKLDELLGKATAPILALATRQQEQIGTLAENSQTGDDKSKNKMLTYIALAAIGGGIYIAAKK